MAAAAAAVAASSLSMTASFVSSPLLNKTSRLPFSPNPLPQNHFGPKPLPKLAPHKTQFRPNLSIIFCFSSSRYTSASFDDFLVTQNEEEKEEKDDDDDYDDDGEFSLSETEQDEDDLEDDYGDEEAPEDQKRKGSRSREMGRLYVGNLPYTISSSQLAEVFGEAGRVDSVEIVYDRVTDRSRGFGFVMMNTGEDARKAIRMFDGALVGGRTVKVNFPEVPKGGEREVMGPKIRNSYRGYVDTPHKIYAGNLSWTVTSQRLKDAFGHLNGFLSAKVIYSKDSGKSRGFGFVSFASADEVQYALNATNGVELEGRPLKLNLAAERAPPTRPPAVERKNTEPGFHTSEMFPTIIT